MSLIYTNQKDITVDQFAELLISSGIHRPVADKQRLEKMLTYADSLWTVWDGEKLVGIARSLTDYSYACYVSDLAVDKDYQQKGIGKTLLTHLSDELGEDVAIVLLSAPTAMNYYPKVDFQKAENAFLKPRKPF